MRAWGEWRPAVRAVAAVTATCLAVVLLAWATRIGPDEVFTGPGPQRNTLTAEAETCIPLPERTLPDGTTEVVIPDDFAERDYCDPPPASRDDYLDIVEDNPPPLWVKVLVTLVLGGLLVGIALLAGWLIRTLLADARARRTRRDPRSNAVFDVLAEPDRISGQVAADVDEQEALLRTGDPRNAIVECWHRFEVQGERAGVPRRDAETSAEYALRILDLAEADADGVSGLAELYREARFSDHPITEDHRARALAALERIRVSVQVRA